jgi:hypothetical protein
MSAMRFLRSLEVIVGVVFLSLAFVGVVRSSESDQKTIVTFNQPVEIPGKVLTPGTYVFKVFDSPGTRDVIQVLNKNEDHVVATFLAIPASTDKPFDKPFIRFAERASGSPPAIEAWFYPGRTDGHEFVYPRQHALELAKANNQNVASMPDKMKSDVTELSKSTTAPSANDTNQPSVVDMKNATLTEVTPEDQDVATETTVFAIALITPAEANSEMETDSAHKQVSARSELPKTASALPLLAFLAALSVVAGLMLGVFARRLA